MIVNFEYPLLNCKFISVIELGLQILETFRNATLTVTVTVSM